jgi:NhaA family Na+:H+ antiporter
LASFLAIKSSVAVAPDGISIRNLLGAACLCGIGDTVSLLLADQAFPHGAIADVAKIGVLIGSVLAALVGAAILALRSPSAAVTQAVATQA